MPKDMHAETKTPPEVVSREMSRNKEAGNAHTVRNLKIAVALSDKTATEISREAGLSLNVLGKYLRGETDMTHTNMLKVCRVLGLPIGLVSSSEPITEARVRLFKILERKSEADIQAVIDQLRGG